MVARLLSKVQVYCLAQLVASGCACRVTCTSLTFEVCINGVAACIVSASQNVGFALIELDGRELALAREQRDLHFVPGPVLAPRALAD